MDAGERERLRLVCDKLMRQFASAVATLVAEGEDEDENLDQYVFADRLHAVFSNLALSKPDLSAYLLEDDNFDHYCLALWHKYSGMDNDHFEEFLQNWPNPEPASDSLRTSSKVDSVPASSNIDSDSTPVVVEEAPNVLTVLTAEEKAAEQALLSPQSEERTSETPTTSPLPSSLLDEQLMDPPKKSIVEEEDFWSAPSPETKGGLVEPPNQVLDLSAAAVEEVADFPAKESIVAPTPVVDEKLAPLAPKDLLAMMMLDIDEEEEAPPKPSEPIPAPAPKPQEVEVVVAKEPEVSPAPIILVPSPVVLAPSPVVLVPSPKPLPVAETSLQVYRRLVKDMAARECFTMEQLKFLLRMRAEKGITEQDHAGVLSDLEITPALFAQYIKNGQKGWSKPVSAGASLEAIVLGLIARLIASEDPNEQVSLARELIDAKRAVDEDRRANPVEEENAEFQLERKSNGYTPVGPPLSHSPSGNIIVIPLSPSSSSSSSFPPPTYNPALSSSTSLFTATTTTPSIVGMERSVSIPLAFSSSSFSSSSSVSPDPAQRTSLFSNKGASAIASSPPPPPAQRTSLFSNKGASAVSSPPPPPPQTRTSLFSNKGASAISSPPVAVASSPSPNNSAMPQRTSLFSANGASQIAPPPPLRMPSSSPSPSPPATPHAQQSIGARNDSIISVSGASGLARSPSGMQVGSPSVVGSPAINRSPSTPSLAPGGNFDPPPPAYDPPPYGAPPPSYGAPPSYNVAISSPSSASSISRDGREYWSILAPIRVRDAPATTGNPIGKLDPGTICVSTQRQGSWFKHSQGWSMYEGDGKTFAQALNPDSLVAYQSTLILRIRSAPSATASEVGFLQPGQTVLALEIQGNWLRHEMGWSMIASDPAAAGPKKIFLQMAGPKVADPCTYYEALLQIRIRQQPAIDGAEVGMLFPGQVVRCLEIQGPWLRHETGWSLVSGELNGQQTPFMKPTSAPSEGKQKPFYEVVHPLRVRAAPSAAAAEVATLELGQRVKCLEIQGFWLRHDLGWSMIHSDPSKGEKRPFLQQVTAAYVAPSSPASPMGMPNSPSRSQLDPRQQQPQNNNTITFEVVSPAGLRVRDSPTERGKEVALLRPGQTIVGTEIQGVWVRHSLGWSMIFSLGKKGEKVFFFKAK